jgi:hypothetical protein
MSFESRVLNALLDIYLSMGEVRRTMAELDDRLGVLTPLVEAIRTDVDALVARGTEVVLTDPQRAVLDQLQTKLQEAHDAAQAALGMPTPG